MSVRSKPSESAPWVPFEDRRRARDQKREAVLRMSVKMFLEEGYHRTALTKVATRLNITKPALYNYFGSKEEILLECCRLGGELFDENIAAIERQEGDGLTKLRALIRAYAQLMTEDFGMCLVRLDDRELSPQDRAEVRRAKRRIDTAFRQTISRGIADGSIRPCDPKLTTFIIARALSGIGEWFSPDGEKSAHQIAETFVTQLTDGLVAPQRAKPKTTRKRVPAER